MLHFSCSSISACVYSLTKCDDDMSVTTTQNAKNQKIKTPKALDPLIITTAIPGSFGKLKVGFSRKYGELN